MLLKLGVAMMLLSVTLAAGVAVAVVGFRGEESPATSPVSSVEPRAAEVTAAGTAADKKKYNPGEKLEIDHGSSKAAAPEEQAGAQGFGGAGGIGTEEAGAGVPA
jgi:hypothetical protein